MRTSYSSACRFAASMSLPLALAACGDSPITPDDAGAQSASTAAALAEIIDKLETIEERIDSLQATVEATSGGELVLTGLPAAQLDSILDLASFLAVDVTSGAWEACGKVGLALDYGLELDGQAEGEAVGSLGAWAGTGAFIGAKLKPHVALGGGVKLEGEGGVEFCHPIGGESPPVRPAPAGPMRSPELDQLATTLNGLTSQFNLTATSLNQSLGGISNAIASPGSLTLANLGGQVPLPPALASMAADPVGTISGRIQGLSLEAQDALCSSNNWGTNLSAVITEACDIIDAGGIANFTAFNDITASFPAVQNVVSTVCGRVNAIWGQRISISSWDVTFPLGIGTVQVFPGYNQRLFPNVATLACS